MNLSIMHIVYSKGKEIKDLSLPFSPVPKTLNLPEINRHFLSLETRIMVIERYVFRFKQIEELRAKMMKIA